MTGLSHHKVFDSGFPDSLNIIPDQEDKAPSSAVRGAHGMMKSAKDVDGDSYVQVSETSTPAQIMCESMPTPNPKADSLENKDPNSDTASQQAQVIDDSFVDQIKARSPTKPIKRIEDSVEAIDAFEDEIEKVGAQLPTLDNSATPVNSSKSRKVTKGSVKQVPGSAASKVTSGHVEPGGTVKYQKKALESRALSNPTFKKRVSSVHKAPFQPVKSSKPPTVSNFELPGDAVSRKLKEQREERLRRGENGEQDQRQSASAQVPRVKSTKPLTRSSFELPGEAVARKLKEQREERSKQQEAQVQTEKKEVTPRTVRLSSTPMVKPTTTSRARASLARGSGAENENSNPRAPGVKAVRTKRTSSMAPSLANRRVSSLSVARHTSTVQSNASARSSLIDPRVSPTSTASALQHAESNGKGIARTSRGKEVFERSKSAKDEQDRLRKEKEEAAKKARTEAAERGRIASRQWAEKQKARKASAEKAEGGSRREAEAT